MVNAGDTISVSVTEDDVRLVEEFDRYFEQTEGTHSRAARIKEAMQLYQDVHELASDLEHVVDPDDMGAMQFRHYVRQAILDLDRAEAAANR